MGNVSEGLPARVGVGLGATGVAVAVEVDVEAAGEVLLVGVEVDVDAGEVLLVGVDVDVAKGGADVGVLDGGAVVSSTSCGALLDSRLARLICVVLRPERTSVYEPLPVMRDETSTAVHVPAGNAADDATIAGALTGGLTGAFWNVIVDSLHSAAGTTETSYPADDRLLAYTFSVARVIGPSSAGTSNRRYERMIGEPSTRIFVPVPKFVAGWLAFTYASAEGTSVRTVTDADVSPRPMPNQMLSAAMDALATVIAADLVPPRSRACRCLRVAAGSGRCSGKVRMLRTAAGVATCASLALPEVAGSARASAGACVLEDGSSLEDVGARRR